MVPWVMKIKTLPLTIFGFFYGISVLFAGGASEGGGSNRGTYLSHSGYTILPEDIKIEHYIAQNDFDYPAYILMGLKGQKPLGPGRIV
jgi:hypothetical protein